MKSKILSIFIIVFALTFVSAKTIDSENIQNDGRECCTKTIVFDGGYISITACAGWFLSNSANAMTRACAKVDQAMQDMIQ